jgi:hypothetical protein
MADPFPVLIRLARRTVETAQADLASRRASHDALVAERAALDAAMAGEKRLAAPGTSIEPWLARMRLRRTALDAVIESAALEVEQARAALADAFAGQKRLEIVDDARAESRRRAREKVRAEALDEIAIQRAARNRG